MAFYPNVKVLMAYADTSTPEYSVLIPGPTGDGIWLDVPPGDMFTMLVNALASGNSVTVQTDDGTPDRIYRGYLLSADNTKEEQEIIQKAAAEKGLSG